MNARDRATPSVSAAPLLPPLPAPATTPYNRRMTNRSDVLVLGGGVVGLASAVQLLRAGRSVTVLERGRAGGATSRGNCGTITPSHATPLAMPGMVAKAIKLSLIHI